MNVKKQELKKTKKRFALTIIKLVEALLRERTAGILSRHLLNEENQILVMPSS
jgi:hypothetical protein